MARQRSPQVKGGRRGGGGGGRPGTLVAAFPIVHAHGGGKPIAGRTGPGVADHYALSLESPAALLGWGTALAAAGISVSAAGDEAGSPALASKDPDGQAIELVARASQQSTASPAGTGEAGR